MDGSNQNPSGENNQIRQVWAYNFAYEMSRLDCCLQSHSILSIDTEFPGFFMPYSRSSIDEELYARFRFNVNLTKMIQLGLTALDESGSVGGSWEFNFSDFDPRTDFYNPSSIVFLMENGFNFKRLNRKGVSMSLFARYFLHIVRKNKIFRWITFHGLYDIGYLMKAMGIVKRLPKSMREFATIVVNQVGFVRDLKYMARLCEGLEQGQLGLRRLAKLLDQNPLELKHHAGSNSLLTALIHVEMLQRFDLGSEICDGFFYGFSNKLELMAVSEPEAAISPLYSSCYATLLCLLLIFLLLGINILLLINLAL